MGAIDVGNAATDRSASGTSGRHFIDSSNPANATGIITSIEVWAATDMTEFQVATLYLVSGTIYKVRAIQTIGNVTAGSKQTFPVSLAVVASDLLGCFFNIGSLEADTSGGAGIFYKAAENAYVVGEEVEYTALAWNISLYGTGVSPVKAGLIPKLIAMGQL